MLLLIVIICLVGLLCYKGRPIVAPAWTPPTQPWPPQQLPHQPQQGFAPNASVPHVSQPAQGSAPTARPTTFAPPPSAPVAGGFAPPPTAEELAAKAKSAPLPPPPSLDDVLRRPGA